MKTEELNKFQRRLHTSSYMHAECEISFDELEKQQAEILEDYAKAELLGESSDDTLSEIDFIGQLMNERWSKREGYTASLRWCMLCDKEREGFLKEAEEVFSKWRKSEILNRI